MYTGWGDYWGKAMYCRNADSTIRISVLIDFEIEYHNLFTLGRFDIQLYYCKTDAINCRS